MSKQIDLVAILADLKAIETIFKQNAYLGGILANIESSASNDYIIGKIDGFMPIYKAICKISCTLHKAQDAAVHSVEIRGEQKEMALATAFDIPIDEPLDRIMKILGDYDNDVLEQLIEDSESDFQIIDVFINCLHESQ